VVFAGVALTVLAIGFVSARSYRDLADSRARVARLEAEIERRKGAIESLELRIEGLRDDPYTLERLARQELGMARSGEIIVVLPQSESLP
jgi:cell division protein FtsB